MRTRHSRTVSVLVAATLAALLVPGVAWTQSADPPVGDPVPGDDSGFLTGPNEGAPEGIAIDYLQGEAATYGLSSSDVADLAVRSSYRSDHNGVTHVNLNQRFDGIEVFGADTTVNLMDDGRVLFVGGTSFSRLEAVSSAQAELGAAEGVQAAAEALGLDEPENLRVLRRRGGAAQETVLSGGGISDEPIPARLGWQPTPGGLRLAWQLVIDDSSGEHLWNATIDAETGELLEVDDWTSEDTLDSLTATLARGGGASSTSSSALAAAASTAASSASTPAPSNPVDDGSSYRVFALPKESPNDGPSSVVTNPADADASPFGWHDVNATPEPDFTITRGNNVHAYLDQDANNQPDPGFDVDGGPGLTFEFDADLSEHAQRYRDGVVTNLFYWNNVFHDLLWRFGFDEPSGNFQANNYGRGGGQGDYVRAEAADGAGTNNANFSTPAADAGTPRMQMFLWPGNQFGLQNQVMVDGLGEFGGSWARFAEAPSNAGQAGEIIDAGNGCNDAGYPDTLPSGDWIALVTTGSCTNPVKGQVAQAQGADALIVSGGATAGILTGAISEPRVTIPVMSLNTADGNTIRGGLPAAGMVRKHPDHPGIRDGDFEAGIIIHEYGHGVSNRLTGGAGINCLGGSEQMGEGWSDYVAIAALIDPALDDPAGPRGMGPYALFQDSRQGAGIRPRPYSRTMEIQPFTYDSITTGGWLNGASLAAPHGVGHGWAAVLWDMTWDLIDKHGFNPNVYDNWDTGGNILAYQLMVDGLKFQGCNPTFVIGRDAIIAADAALTGGDNACTLWASFARRGLGYSAVGGSNDRNDNTEAFDTHPDCRGTFHGQGPGLRVAQAGATVPLIFSLDGNQGLDIFASNPYSRQIDCFTLETVDPDSPFITPRPLPVETRAAGSGLTYDADEDRYNYPWRTERAWDGTCREVVLTHNDGFQHRAFVRFTTEPLFTVSGQVRGTDDEPLAGATVTIELTSTVTTTTDAGGFYSFQGVPRGTYEAMASAGGCYEPQTQELVVSRPTTLNFALPQRSDTFGHTCGFEVTPFEEAETVVPIAGNNIATTIDLPFTFSFYGFPHTRTHVCTNGFIEFVGPASTNCSSGNAAIPTAGRPNGGIYSFWDNLFVDDDASIRADARGTAPSRRFVIEFRNVHFSGDTSRRVDFNVVLFENGEILTQYRNLADDERERGSSATIGIENHTGTDAFRFSFNEPVLAPEPAVTSVRYRPPSLAASHTVSGQVRDALSQPVANATVTIEGTPITPATTDADGFYSFERVPEGTYSATASSTGCDGTQTRELVVSGPTTLDFELPRLTEVLLIPDSTGDRVMAFDPTTGDLIHADYIPADPDANLGTPQHMIPNLDDDGYLLSDQIRHEVYAYDLEGNWQGVFAPAGGADTSILQNMRGIGISPDGTLLATVAAGGNAHAVAEFDADGNYIGNFIDNQAGGMEGPWYILHRDSDVLVSSVTSSAIHRFDLDGLPLGVFHGPISFPQQMQELDNGNILVASFSTPAGVWELDSDGNLIDIYTGVGSNRGVYELPNGNILTTNGSGVHEIDRGQTLVETKISGVSARKITPVTLHQCAVAASPP